MQSAIFKLNQLDIKNSFVNYFSKLKQMNLPNVKYWFI